MSGGPDDARIAAEIVALARRRAEALAAGDEATLMELLHARLRWTTHTGEVLNRDQYVAGNTRGALRWIGQRLEDADVQLIGDAAVLTAVAVDDVQQGDGEPEVFRLRLTLVWARSHGVWRCVAGHAGPRLA